MKGPDEGSGPSLIWLPGRAVGISWDRSAGTTYMRYISTLLMCSLLVGCGRGGPEPAKQRFQNAMSKLAAADSPELRFYALPGAAKESFAAGKIEDDPRAEGLPRHGRASTPRRERNSLLPSQRQDLQDLRG